MIDPQHLRTLEQQHGLPVGLLSAVMKQESGGDPNALSPKGAQGIFQFMPDTAKAYGIDPLDPMQAADGAARMYGDLSRQYKGDLPSMLAAYNWGSGNLAQNGLQNAPAETQDYIKKITAALPQYAQAAPQATSDATVTNVVPTSNVQEYMNVEMPDGTVVTDVPVGTTKAQLMEKLKASGISHEPLQQNAEQPGLLARTGQDIAQAGKKAADLWQQSISGELNPAMAGVQILGEGAKAAFALPGEAMASAFGALPESIKQPIAKGAAAVAEPIANAPSALAKYAEGTQTGRDIGDFLSRIPGADKVLGQIADTGKAAANIALSVPAGKGLRAIASEGASPVLTGVGGAIEKSGIKAAEAKKMDFVKDLILPKATPGVREDLVGRTKEVGFNRRQVVQLTPQEQEIADTVSSIQGVKRGNSLQGNANAIQDANHAEAQNLISKLQKNDVAISSEDIAAGFGKVADELAKNPYLSGVDASKSARTVVSNAMEFVQKNPRTAAGLLQARKDFDAWVKAQKPNIFDAADAPVSVAVRQVRQAINDMVDAAVPDAEVKASLRKQSNLYRAHDNIATKAKDEAPTRIGRAKESIGHAITLKNSIAGAGALAGLGATGTLLPAVGILGAGALARYGAKSLTSPTMRKAIGGSLRKIGETIK